ncbi:hypothetical protein CHS0354_038385 [Potamilus streckersoni]|uniref:Receptor ligand binding region domain-containing protein n=1 Tax=Potamilus streckersoni TaxID=2493646 RepID=A0AAE0VQ44_9BIVA|nr:hypothetical protein CHS0354_038385 [Potamilus streckersoni]
MIRWIAELCIFTYPHLERRIVLIPFPTSGYDLFDNCNNEDLTTAMNMDLRQYGGPVKAADCLNDTLSHKTYPGVFVTSSIETAKVIRTMLPKRIPLLRPVSSAPDLDQLPNILKTSSRPDVYAQAFVELIKYLRWNYISLIYTNDSHGRSYKDLIRKLAFKEMICITSEIPFTPLEMVSNNIADNIVGQLAKDMPTARDDSLGVVYVGSLSGLGFLLDRVCNKSRSNPLLVSNLHWIFVGDSGFDASVYDFKNAIYSKRCVESVSKMPLFITLTDSLIGSDDFLAHFNGLLSNASYDGPLSSWIDEYKTWHCKMGACTPDKMQIKRLADSMYSLATMVKNHIECVWLGGCSNLDIASTPVTADSLRKTVVNYSTIDRYHLPISLRTSRSFKYANDGYIEYLSAGDGIEIYATEGANLSYLQVGLFHEGKLKFRSSGIKDSRSSICKSSCPYCLTMTETKFTFIPGDYLLLGLFSIHLSGDNPYSCGKLRPDKNAIMTVSAFMEAIKGINKKHNLRFGGLAIDDCYSPFNTSIFLSDFFSKRVLLKDPMTGSVIDSDRVVVIIGALSSRVSLIVADQATELGIPMISYAASISKLDDRRHYPYFMRTVPSETLQVDTLVKLLKSFGFTHVGALYYDTQYGRDGIFDFKTSAEIDGICVEEPLMVSKDDNDDDIENVLRRLYQTNSRVVVYFGISDITIRILNVLEKSFSNNKPLVFFASETWGTNKILIERRSANFAKGSIVLATYTRKHVDGSTFRQYLLTFNSTSTSENMWLPRFWEDVYNCDLKQSFQKTHSSVCASDILHKLDDEKLNALYWEQRAIHVTQAVFSVGAVFAKVSRSICRNLMYCKELRNQPETLYDALLLVQLKADENGEIFQPFNNDGNGNSGFYIYNIQRGAASKLVYEKVGTMDINEGLIIDTRKVKFYNELGHEHSLSSEDEVKCAKIPRCHDICLPISYPQPDTSTISTASPIVSTDKSDKTLMLTTIFFGVTVGVLVVVLLVLITLLLRKQPISKLQYQERVQSTPSSLNNIIGNVYDEPGSQDPSLRGSRENLNIERSIHYSEIRPFSQKEQPRGLSHVLLSNRSITESTIPSLVAISKTLSSQDVSVGNSRSSSLGLTISTHKNVKVSPLLDMSQSSINPVFTIDNSKGLSQHISVRDLKEGSREHLVEEDITEECETYRTNRKGNSKVHGTNRTHTLTYLSARDLDMGVHDEEEDEFKENDELGNRISAENSRRNSLASSRFGEDKSEHVSESSRHDTDTLTPPENSDPFSTTLDNCQHESFDFTESVDYTVAGHVVYNRRNNPSLRKRENRTSLTSIPDIIPYVPCEISEEKSSVYI